MSDWFIVKEAKCTVCRFCWPWPFTAMAAKVGLPSFLPTEEKTLCLSHSTVNCYFLWYDLLLAIQRHLVSIIYAMLYVHESTWPRLHNLRPQWQNNWQRITNKLQKDHQHLQNNLKILFRWQTATYSPTWLQHGWSWDEKSLISFFHKDKFYHNEEGISYPICTFIAYTTTKKWKCWKLQHEQDLCLYYKVKKNSHQR